MDENRIYHLATGHAKSMKIKTLNRIAKSICKILKIGTNSKGTGFFIIIDYEDTYSKFLVTAHHLLSKDIVDAKKSIEVILENPNIKQIIKLNEISRKIICLQEQDITAIEINEKDLIDKYVEYLHYDMTYILNGYGFYLNKDVFILHHSNGEEIECSSGLIVKIKDPKIFEFQHTLDTDKGASGSPILLFEDSNNEAKVMGIHTSGNIYNKNNIGTFIGELVKKINIINGKTIFYFYDKSLTNKNALIVPNNSIVTVE